MDQNEHILWYFADPMCSWCWGFSPVIEAIKKQFADDLKIALILGGLRPGTTEPVTASFREEIFQHWRHVKDLSGQSFTFEGAMPEGFIYNTEPPSRAVVAMGEIKPEVVLSYLHAIQHAFYVERQDVTRQDVLTKLASRFKIDEIIFQEQLNSETVRQKTWAHFSRARQFGVRGFPTIILQRAQNLTLLTRGYRSFTELKPGIDQWLQEFEPN